jgi:vacuolar-type H+-ATPase subunit H
MSGSDLRSLERDVEQARDRFAHDLARLRSPETISEFKDTLWAEARETKDELVEKTKQAAQDGIQRIIADLKERAAANPAAILAIGAGLAWRLIHRPPIASLLVGIGLVSLFRPQTGGEVVAGASKLLHSAKDTAQEWGEDLRQASSDGGSEIAERAPLAAGQISDMARGTVTRITDKANLAAGQISDMARGTVTRITDKANLAAGQISDMARETVTRITDKANSAADHAGRESLAQIGATAASTADRASSIIHDAVSDPETRDRYLLGAAALAVAAAVGIAYQRRAADGGDRP